MKFIGSLIRLVLITVVLAVIFHDFAARIILEWSLGYGLGVSVKVREARVDLKRGEVLFEGIEIGNPGGFPSGSLANIPQIFLDLEWLPLLEGRLRFKTVGISFEKIHVVRNEQGLFNLLELKAMKDAGSGLRKSFEGGSSGRDEAEGKSKAMQVDIDELVLTIGQATFADFMQPNAKEIRFQIGIDHAVYHRVDGASDIAKIVAWETLKKIGFSGIANVLGVGGGKFQAGQGFFSKIFSAVKDKMNS